MQTMSLKFSGYAFHLPFYMAFFLGLSFLIENLNLDFHGFWSYLDLAYSIRFFKISKGSFSSQIQSRSIAASNVSFCGPFKIKLTFSITSLIFTRMDLYNRHHNHNKKT